MRWKIHQTETYAWRRRVSLLVPVVDLVNVAKHDLVLSLHVIRDAFLLHPSHVALEDTHEKHVSLVRQPSSGVLSSRRTHLHHQAEVSHVVFLRLHQLQQDVAAADDRFRQPERQTDRHTRR